MTGWLRDLRDFGPGDCEHRSAIERAGKKGGWACVLFILGTGGQRYRGAGVSGNLYVGSGAVVPPYLTKLCSRTPVDA